MKPSSYIISYFPGIILFIISLLIACATYQDYGVSWDEPDHQKLGVAAYDFITGANKHLFDLRTKVYGTGFELPLVFIEKKIMATANTRDIYLMRHLVSHIFFLASALFGYVLALRLFKNQFIACLGYVMLAFSPAIYAHSYFNPKDLPLLSMFIISFTVFQAAFERRKAYLFLLLGMACGYTTGIRIMGVLLVIVIMLFLFIDLCRAVVHKNNIRKSIVSIVLFGIGFCVLLLLSWPYLWPAPIDNFISSFSEMSRYNWGGDVFLMGRNMPAANLPWFYFPVWFMATNPVLWLVAGIGGIIIIVVNIIHRPLYFFTNKADRNYLFYLLCFTAPVFAIYYFHSVIYDGWRHLYFVYPSFVFMGLYAIDKIYREKYKIIIQALCVLQVGILASFMIINHPFQQVYFNELVPRKKEYIRKHFEFDYWGVSYYQGLEYLLKNTTGTIKISCSEDPAPLLNNIMLLQPWQRDRIRVAGVNDADYFMTTFRSHSEGFSYPELYSLKVLNSTMMCIYKMH